MHQSPQAIAMVSRNFSDHRLDHPVGGRVAILTIKLTMRFLTKENSVALCFSVKCFCEMVRAGQLDIS